MEAGGDITNKGLQIGGKGSDIINICSSCEIAKYKLPRHNENSLTHFA